jgi:hypothetical protein
MWLENVMGRGHWLIFGVEGVNMLLREIVYGLNWLRTGQSDMILVFFLINIDVLQLNMWIRPLKKLTVT